MFEDCLLPSPEHLWMATGKILPIHIKLHRRIGSRQTSAAGITAAGITVAGDQKPTNATNHALGLQEMDATASLVTTSGAEVKARHIFYHW